MAEDRFDTGRSFDRRVPLATAKDESRRDDGARFAFAGSLLLHLAIFMALALVAPPRLPTDVAVRGVEVELMTEAPTEIARSPPLAATPSPTIEREQAQAAPSPSTPEGTTTESPTKAASPAPEPATDDGLIHARRLLSAAVLADPRSRPAREALRGIAPEERITQLCNLEAMEQIHAWKATLQPQTVIADALAEADRSTLSVDAKGAAFASGGRWYELGFRCVVTSDLEKVSGFAFRVGRELSKAERLRHDLPQDAGGMD